MDLQQFVDQLDLSLKAPRRPGWRPHLFVLIPTRLEGKLFRLEFGDAKIDGKVIDRRDIAGKPHTAVRFDALDAVEELKRAGYIEDKRIISS